MHLKLFCTDTRFNLGHTFQSLDYCIVCTLSTLLSLFYPTEFVRKCQPFNLQYMSLSSSSCICREITNHTTTGVECTCRVHCVSVACTRVNEEPAERRCARCDVDLSLAVYITQLSNMLHDDVYVHFLCSRVLCNCACFVVVRCECVCVRV